MNEEIKNKIKRIILGILLMVVPILVYVYIDSTIRISNTLEILMIIISIVCMFVGFSILGFILFGFDKDNATIRIAGKKIDNDAIINIKKMTFKEKIKAFNIIGIILRLLGVPAFLGLILSILGDPLKFFSLFKNESIARLIAVFLSIIGVNLVFLFIPKKWFSKLSVVIVSIIIECIFIYYIFYYMSNINEIESYICCNLY